MAVLIIRDSLPLDAHQLELYSSTFSSSSRQYCTALCPDDCLLKKRVVGVTI